MATGKTPFCQRTTGQHWGRTGYLWGKEEMAQSLRPLYIITALLIVVLSNVAAVAADDPNPAPLPEEQGGTWECGTPRIHQMWMEYAQEHNITTKADVLRLQSSTGPAKAYAVGETETFWCQDDWYASDGVDNDGDGVVDWPDYDEFMYLINASCLAIGNTSVIFLEEEQEVPDDEIEKLKEEFEGTIFPEDTETFGSPSDVDGDGKILLLLLDIRDRNYYDQAYIWHVGGYFSSRNTIRTGFSNYKDMIYIDIEPTTSYEWDSITAHEFQHLIHYHQDPFENTWVDEGCSGYAEYICYGENGPWSHITSFLSLPDTSLTPTDEDWYSSEGSRLIAHYGASYLWTLYLAEHYGDLSGDRQHEHFIRDLVAERGTGIEGVDAALADHGYKESFEDLFKTWVVANYLDNTDENPLHGYATLALPGPEVSGSVTLNESSHTFTEKTLSRWSAAYYEITTARPENLTVTTDDPDVWTETMPERDTVGVVVSPLQTNGNFKLSVEVESASEKPSADFKANVTTGQPPLAVGFTDMSSGGPTAWTWDFGDGGTAGEQNPVHIYNTSGTYTVSLAVSNAGGSDTMVKSGYITVGPEEPATITLSRGWNFVSTPKRLADGSDTVGAVFGDIDTGGHAILTYDQNLGLVPMASEDRFEPLDALWVYANRSTTVSLVYESDPLRVPPSKVLSSGWNAIGSPAAAITTADRALHSVQQEWTEIIGYDPAAQAYETPIMNGGTGEYNDSRTLVPTGGYWIFVTENCTLASISQ